MSSHNSGQATFGDDGSIDTPETYDNDLSAYGVDAEPERETRRDVPTASTFGVDDRPTDGDRSTDSSRQETLVVDAEQATITAQTEEKPILGEVYGATMKTPIPDAERANVGESVEAVDSRALPGTGLEPLDFARQGNEIELGHDRADLEDGRRFGETPTDQDHYLATGATRAKPDVLGEMREPSDYWTPRSNGYSAHGTGASITRERQCVGCFDVTLSGGDGSSHVVAEMVRYHVADEVMNRLSNHVTPDDIRAGGNQIADAVAPVDGAAFEAEESEDEEEEAEQEPTDDSDERDAPAPKHFGDYRREKVERLENTPRLNPIETFDTLEDMADAIEAIHVEDYSNPPEKTLTKLRANFEKLPTDETERHYLTDYKLTRTINAARRAFNEWVGRKKRYDEMPGAMEVGPSNYPKKKQNRLSASERKAREKLDEKLSRLHGRTKGAFRRALKKAGISEAELNEARREETREERRETFEKGDLVFYSCTVYGNALWGVKRVNKKSVRLRRPHGSAGREMPMSDGEVYPEYDETRVDLESSRLNGPIPAEKIAAFDVDDTDARMSDDAIAVRADTADEARRIVFGDEWIDAQ